MVKSNSEFKSLLILLGMLVLATIVVLGFSLMMPKNFQEPSQTNLNTSSNGSAETPAATSLGKPTEKAKNTFEVVIKGGKIVGNSEFSVISGEPVVFNITSDTAGEFRIDGTDKKLELEKNIQFELMLTPVLVGRFPLKFGASSSEIGALAVYPK